MQNVSDFPFIYIKVTCLIVADFVCKTTSNLVVALNLYNGLALTALGGHLNTVKVIHPSLGHSETVGANTKCILRIRPSRQSCYGGTVVIPIVRFSVQNFQGIVELRGKVCIIWSVSCIL